MSATSFATLLAACVLGGENRLWLLELELRGACEAVRLDCGPDGATRLSGPFASSEQRVLLVPVPVRSPLGAEGLSALPLPRVEVEPPGAGAEGAVLRWSAAQPAEELRRSVGALLARPRPPVAEALAHAAAPELLLVLAAGGFLLALRRRPAACAALALAAGLGAVALARTRAPAARGARVTEWEAEAPLALDVQASRDRLALPHGALEVVPEGARLELAVPGNGSGGSASAPGARLAGLEGVPPPTLAVGRNDGPDLSEVWTRNARGEWWAHGPWPAGAALGEPRSGAPDPPGWLASALPPGRTVLLARTETGDWLRCLGFALE